MSHTERLRRSPRAFRQLTGITPLVFDKLLADLTPRHEQDDARRKDRPGRRRRPGAGRKHALVLADRLLIAAVSESFPGSVHDKKVYDRTRAVGPPDARRTGDTAYIGTPLETPTRKPRGGELTAAQREKNRRVSRRRIVAEHGIGKMKIWRIAAERYRNPNRRHTL